MSKSTHHRVMPFYGCCETDRPLPRFLFASRNRPPSEGHIVVTGVLNVSAEHVEVVPDTTSGVLQLTGPWFDLLENRARIYVQEFELPRFIMAGGSVSSVWRRLHEARDPGHLDDAGLAVLSTHLLDAIKERIIDPRDVPDRWEILLRSRVLAS